MTYPESVARDTVLNFYWRAGTGHVLMMKLATRCSNHDLDRSGMMIQGDCDSDGVDDNDNDNVKQKFNKTSRNPVKHM